MDCAIPQKYWAMLAIGMFLVACSSSDGQDRSGDTSSEPITFCVPNCGADQECVDGQCVGGEVAAECGDGEVQTGEACDDGEANSDTDPDTCRTNCTAAFCGDGVVDTGEACDEGDANADGVADACSTSCVSATCGDGVLDMNEQCDSGDEGNSDTLADACRTSCLDAYCGDGVLDTDEACDDGEENSDTVADACRSDCSNAYCGDGAVDTEEECDGGADISDTVADACRPGCFDPTCGDGVIDTDEVCDNGGDNSDDLADACRTTCDEAECGDNVVDTGEDCDFGDTEPRDGCSADCEDELNIAGRVSLLGRSVLGVFVELTGPVTDMVTTARITRSNYTFENLAPGEYTVTPLFGRHQFAPGSRQVVLNALNQNTVDFDLEFSGLPLFSDTFEGDDAVGSATRLSIDGPLQLHTVYPAGDEDWYSLELTGGETYEIFTEFHGVGGALGVTLYAPGDTETGLFYRDGGGRTTYTPETSGTYSLLVNSYEPACSIDAYVIGVDTLVDPDADGFGPFFDCDNRDPLTVGIDEPNPNTISPIASDTPGDGISSNCTGFDSVQSSVSFGDHTTSDAALEVLPTPSRGGYGRLFLGPLEGLISTLVTTDELWFRLTVPPNACYSFAASYSAGNSNLRLEFFVEGMDGLVQAQDPVLASSSRVWNRTPADREYFIRTTLQDTATGYRSFLPVYYDSGEDQDLDEYCTVASETDLDDTFNSTDFSFICFPFVCFAEGTLVWTRDGQVPIEEVAVGDEVLSRDPETFSTGWSPVDETLTSRRPVLELEVTDTNDRTEVFRVTEAHPFWVKARGWVGAAALRPGDVLSSAHGAGLWVREVRATGEVETVYNLSVSGYETYFVGDLGVWVHNK